MIGDDETESLAGDVFAEKKRFSGGTAQLTVLLTGIILAVTAFSILNVLIQQMIRDDKQRLMSDAQDTVHKTLSQVDDALSTAEIVAKLSPGASDSDLKGSILKASPGLTDFDQVLWLKAGADGGWSAYTLLDHDSGNFTQAALKGLAQAILAKKESNQSNATVIITDLPGAQYWQENTDPVVKGRPFVMAKVVTVNGKATGILLGVSRISRLLGPAWLDRRQFVSRIVVRDTESGKWIYYMNHDSSVHEEDIKLDLTGANTLIPVGDEQWQLNVELGNNMQTNILQRTPWLMLIFGVILTALGTLYVRTNQRQSYKMGIMNRELARKNYELNSEISERERLNQAVRKAEREYRAIIDAVSDIIFETSIDGEILFLNDTWEKVTGFDLEQVKGRNLFDLLHPQDQEEQRSNFDALVKGKKGAYRTFTRVRTADGTFRSVELAVSMLRQDENRNMRVVGTFTDVEERRRAEKALSEAEKKYRTIVENAAGGIYQVTPEGQFLSANPAMARILGYDTPEQMLRDVRNAHENVYVNVRDRAYFIRELETIGIVHNFETQVITRSGEKIWVNENARAVKDDDGNTLYYEGSMEDITSRKQAEINLREAKIQSDLANRAKSEFLANMSHELRTPLNAIIGFAEIIRNEVLGPIEKRQYWEYAKDIHESGQRLLTIINEILDVSRIEAGDRQINEGVVNIDEILKSCINFLSPKIESGNLAVANMVEGHLPKVIGEELAVKQVLINLLGNAIKFTPEGGRIKISHEVEPNGRLRLSITDTGIGMEEYEIEKAISAFGQLETAHNRSASGTGLGLTLAESLMKLHGGDLEIFSQKGLGTTATIVFPAKRVVFESREDSDGNAEAIAGHDRRGSDRRQGNEDRRQGDRRTENDDLDADLDDGRVQGQDEGDSRRLH